MKTYRAESDESVVRTLRRNSFVIWILASTALVAGSCAICLWLTYQPQTNMNNVVIAEISCCILVVAGLSLTAHQILTKFADLLLSRIAVVRRSTQDAGHELATPVAILKTRLQLMERAVAQSGSDQANLRVLIEATERMAALIDDIRILALAEDPGKFRDLSMINFSEMAKSVAINMRPACESKSIDLVLKIDRQAIIVGELDALQTVVSNLFSNAIRYNRPGGKLEVSLSVTQEKVLFTVENEGEGISEEALPHVFERFYRANSSQSNKDGGSGLGLAIVKAIVESHLGTISVQSEPNRFTRFLVELPHFPETHPLIRMTKNVRLFPWS